MNNSFLKFRRFVIFLVGLSMCFMQMALQGESRNFTVGLLVIAFYLLVMLPVIADYANSLMADYKSYLKLPLLFFLLLTIMNICYSNGGAIVDMTLLACIIMFALFLAHSEVDEKAIEYAMEGYGIGACIHSILFYFDIGIAYDTANRLWMFGANPNELGTCVCMGMFIVLISFILKDTLNFGVFRFLFLVPVILSFPLIMSTGSRTALFELLLMFVITIILYPTRKSFKIFIIIAGLGLLGYYVNQLMGSDIAMAHRLLTTIEDGNTGGRSDIWVVYLPCIADHPLLGIGQSGFNSLGHQVGLVDSRGAGLSPHNVIIEVLLYTGIVGLLFMATFWTKIGKCAISLFKMNKTILPLLLTIPLLADILSGQILNAKFAWLIYAYIIIKYNYEYKSEL